MFVNVAIKARLAELWYILIILKYALEFESFNEGMMKFGVCFAGKILEIQLCMQNCANGIEKFGENVKLLNDMTESSKLHELFPTTK